MGIGPRELRQGKNEEREGKEVDRREKRGRRATHTNRQHQAIQPLLPLEAWNLKPSTHNPIKPDSDLDLDSSTSRQRYT